MNLAAFTPASIALIIGICLSLLPITPSWASLLGGAVLALTVGNPDAARTKNWATQILSWSIVCLGAGTDLSSIAKAGVDGVGLTVAGLLFCFIVAAILAKLLKVEHDPALLIAVGTGICGGSAIAAVTPVVKAKDEHVSVALATVFILNATALLIFPAIGHWLKLDGHTFGLWAALAVHDTASVVGAARTYAADHGPDVVTTATTVKMARALWIIPMTVLVGFYMNWRRKKFGLTENAASGAAKKPWFVAGFLASAALVTLFADLRPVGKVVYEVGKQGLVVALFLIGMGLTQKALKSVGPRPFLLGVLLWGLVSGATLVVIHP